MDRLVGVVYNARSPGARELAERLARVVGRERAWVCPVLELEAHREQVAHSCLLVTVGGDGTILRVVHVSAPLGVPLVGVNMGRVGFMTELEPEEAEERLPAFLNGEARLEERAMLEVRVRRGREGPTLVGPLLGLNDSVVARGAVARVVTVDAYVDGAFLTTYRADAVLVSTPTGSTGYNLSAGGPVVDPEVPCLVLKPVAPHLGLSHALILPGEAVVHLQAQGDPPILLSVDGFQDHPLQPGDTVEVRRARTTARFLRLRPPRAFYSTLVHRLGGRSL